MVRVKKLNVVFSFAPVIVQDRKCITQSNILVLPVFPTGLTGAGGGGFCLGGDV